MSLSQNPTSGVRSANQDYFRVSSNALLSSEVPGKSFPTGSVFQQPHSSPPPPGPLLAELRVCSLGETKPMACVHTAKPFLPSLFLCSVHCKPGDAYATTHLVCSGKDPILHTIKSRWAAVIEKLSDATRVPAYLTPYRHLEQPALSGCSLKPCFPSMQYCLAASRVLVSPRVRWCTTVPQEAREPWSLRCSPSNKLIQKLESVTEMMRRTEEDVCY